MEEDIEVVKGIIEDYKTHVNIHNEGFTIIYEREIEALENIIQRMEDLYE